MESERVFYVAIIGGFRHLQPDQFEEAKVAARAVGKALAEADLGIIVYDTDDRSLESHVVTGFAAGAANEKRRVILVRYAQSQQRIAQFREQANRPDLFEHQPIPSEDWEVGFYRSIASNDGANALLLMGGGMTTFIAGQIALARGLPIVALQEYEGAAKKIWTELAIRNRDGDAPAWSVGKASEFAAWLRSECTKVARSYSESVELLDSLKRRKTHGRLAIYTAASSLAWIVVLLYGVGIAKDSFYLLVALISSLVLGGATGALLRSLVWGENDEGVSVLSPVVAGAIAALVVGIAYLIPILLGAPGIFDQAEHVVNSADRLQLLSTSLIAVSAGLGFDAVLKRLRDRAPQLQIESQPTSTPAARS
ncbi:hypothetical protein ACC668_02900 [Rhizobium ruizarguesonis]